MFGYRGGCGRGKPLPYGESKQQNTIEEDKYLVPPVCFAQKMVKKDNKKLPAKGSFLNAESDYLKISMSRAIRTKTAAAILVPRASLASTVLDLDLDR